MNQKVYTTVKHESVVVPTFEYLSNFLLDLVSSAPHHMHVFESSDNMHDVVSQCQIYIVDALYLQPMFFEADELVLFVFCKHLPPCFGRSPCGGHYSTSRTFPDKRRNPALEDCQQQDPVPGKHHEGAAGSHGRGVFRRPSNVRPIPIDCCSADCRSALFCRFPRNRLL